MNNEKPPYGVAMQSSAGIGGSSKDVAQTLINGDNPGLPTGVAEKPSDEPHYIVRRLTPTECARLQGFPDAWCSDLAIPHPTEEELDYWQSVWDTWQDLNGLPRRPRSAVRKWLKQPYTDATEYKMWGNGVALPCVMFVLAGIEWATRTNQKAEPPKYDKQLSIFDF